MLCQLISCERGENNIAGVGSFIWDDGAATSSLLPSLML